VVKDKSKKPQIVKLVTESLDIQAEQVEKLRTLFPGVVKDGKVDVDTLKQTLGALAQDWAIVFDGDKRIYFVAKTKGTTDTNKLTPAEQMKIKCGKEHFKNFDGVEFKAPVKTLSDVILE
jgi:Endonuclease domain